MAANLEWISGVLKVDDHTEQYGVIRAGKNMEKFGDPFEFVCTLKRTNDHIYILGAVGEYSRDIYKQIKKIMGDEGIIEVTWEKLNNSARKVTVSTLKDAE